MRAPWETPSLHYLVALLATVQVVNGEFCSTDAIDMYDR